MANSIRSAFIILIMSGFAFSPAFADEEDDLKEERLKAQVLKKIDYLLPLAEAGDAEAQYQLGISYANKPLEDEKEAAVWFDKALAQGHCEAITGYGFLIQSGYKSYKRDKKRALEIFTQGAEADCVRAQTMLGHAYYGGDGTKRSYETSKIWYEKAALQGEYIAAYRLGVQYNMGRGVKKDRAESLYWLKLAIYNDVPGRSLARAQQYARSVERRLDDEEVEAVTARFQTWKNEQEQLWEQAIAE